MNHLGLTSHVPSEDTLRADQSGPVLLVVSETAAIIFMMLLVVSEPTTAFWCDMEAEHVNASALSAVG